VASRVINDLCEKILERERIYCSALAADLAVLTKLHGEAPVREALQPAKIAPPAHGKGRRKRKNLPITDRS
jgi:hypothetical protein